jgi:hypothetical protein
MSSGLYIRGILGQLVGGVVDGAIVQIVVGPIKSRLISSR